MTAIGISNVHSGMLSSVASGASANAESLSPERRPSPDQQTLQIQRHAKATEKKISKQELKQQLSEINRELADANEKISFDYEEKLGRLYVKVIDAKTGEVIREIPPKDFLRHQIAMRELIGLLLNRKV